MKHNVSLIIFFILCCCPGNVLHSQPAILQKLRVMSAADNYSVKNWTSKSGLSQNTVNAILQDAKGFIWIATSDGLARFDGINFKRYSVKEYPALKSNRIITICQAPNDGIFVTTESGDVLLYDGKAFNDLTQTLNPRKQIIWNIVIRDANEVYLLGSDGLFYFSGQELKKINLRNSGSIEAAEHLDRIYLISPDSLLVADGINFYIYNKDRLTAKVHYGVHHTNHIETLTRDYKGNFLFTKADEIFVSRTFEGLANPESVYPGIKAYRVYSSDNCLFVTTHSSGFFKISDNGIEKILDNSVLGEHTGVILLDSEGLLWIGTPVNGAFQLKQKYLYQLDKSYGIKEKNTYAMFRDSKNRIWIGQNQGLQEISDNKIFLHTDRNGLYNNCIWGITEDKSGNIWFATNGAGLFRYDGKKFHHIELESYKESGINFFSAYRDSKGTLWFGSENTISRYINEKFELFHHKNNTRQNPFRNILEDENGKMWFASDLGLYSFEGTNLIPAKDVDAPLSRTLYQDKKKRLWVGTYGYGIRVLFNGKFVSINEVNGLYSDIISTIVEDESGTFWFTTNRGIFSISGKIIDNYLAGKTNRVTCVTRGITDDLANNEFNGGCEPNYIKDADGDFWFPSLGGPVVLYLKNYSTFKKQRPVFIEQLQYGTKTHYPGETILLPADYEQVTIYFNSLNLSDPGNIRFRYKLVGLNKDWIELGSTREITFETLSYGKYEFQVESSDPMGNWNSDAASLVFEVDAKFYETRLFVLVIVLIGIIILVSVFYLKLKFAQRRQQELESVVLDRTKGLLLAKENAEVAAEEEKSLRSQAEEQNRLKVELIRIISHDLRNPLFAIKSYAELLLGESMLQDDDKEIINCISFASDRMSEMILQILSYSKFEGLDHFKNKETISVDSEVQKIIEHYHIVAERKGQIIHTSFTSVGSNIFADRDAFVRIIENLISNAIKYSPSDKTISVQTETENQSIYIIVRDEGLGFSESDKQQLYKPFVKLSTRPTAGESSSGVGLSIVKKFVELNGGTISLVSEKGQGAEFILQFPLLQETK